MKKALSLLAVCVLLVGMMACATFSVSAATPKEEIVATVKEVLPEAYQSKYLPMLENVLKQIEVSAEQAQEVVSYVKAAAAAIESDKGVSLSEYTNAEQAAVLDNFDKACTVLGLTYKFEESENPQHVGDSIVKVYKADGTAVGAFDGEGVKKTDAPESNLALVFALVGALALAAGAGVYGKKLTASR